MAGKQKENRKRRFSLAGLRGYFRNLSPENKTGISRFCGLVLLAFTVFTFVCCVSYLFHWHGDFSIRSGGGPSEELPANLGSRLGLRWSRFLVGGCFGLSAFSIVVLLGMLTYRVFVRRLDSSFLRPFLLALTAAPLFSFILSFFSGLFTSDTFFGGGLGGFAGAEFVRLCEALTGKIGAGLILLLMAVVWLLFASGSFARWFIKFGTGRKRGTAEGAAAGGDGSDVEGDPAGVGVEEADGVEADGGDGLVGADGLVGIVGGSAENDGADAVDGRTGADGDVSVGDGSAKGCGDGLSGTAGDGADSGNGGRESGSGAGGKWSGISRTDAADGGVAGGRNAEGQNAGGQGADPSLKDGEVFSTDGIKELPRIDNRQELERYRFPSLDLLEDYADKQNIVTVEEQQDFINRIRTTLLNFRIKVESISAKAGPTVTLYKVFPAPGVKYASIKNVQNDIGISLGAKGVRVVKLDDAVGIEVANRKSSVVPLKAMLNDDAFRETKAELPVAIGCTITRKVKVFDLAQAPHLLVAGATQQGKSVGLNVIVSSLLYAKHPSELKFVFVDPKMVEFTAYRRLLKHYLAVLPTAGSEEEEAENAIIKKPKDAADVLNSLCVEMDERYALLALAGVNKLKDYNEKYRDRKLLPTEGHKYLPYIVVVIDEFADLTMSSGFGQEGKAMSRGISTAIIRLAQKGRAAGIHLIIATQRPSVSVITGDIKTNFPMRIAFRTVSRIDSMTILDSPGSESLIGRGDMLFYAGVETERVQCALVETAEIDRITKFIESQTGYKECYTTPYYLPTPPSQDDGGSAGGPIDISKIDDMFGDAARLVVSTQKGSTSDLQRKLGLGYARAGRIMDQLEAAGIVGPQEGSKTRQVLVSDYAELESIITSFTTSNA